MDKKRTLKAIAKARRKAMYRGRPWAVELLLFHEVELSRKQYVQGHWRDAVRYKGYTRTIKVRLPDTKLAHEVKE